MRKLRSNFKLVHVSDRAKDVMNGGLTIASLSNYKERFKANTFQKVASKPGVQSEVHNEEKQSSNPISNFVVFSFMQITF